MFKFITEDKHTIEHLPSGMLFLIIINPVDGDDYDAWADVYQEFNFRGNYIISLMLNPEDFEPEPMPVGFQKIHAISRKAFKFFKSKVFIEEYEKPEGEFETERYLLEPSEDGEGWVLADKEKKVVIMWKHKQFKETQKITTLEDFNLTEETFMQVPRLLREAGDWLVKNHSNKL